MDVPLLEHVIKTAESVALAYLGWQFKLNRGSGKTRDSKVDANTDATNVLSGRVVDLEKSNEAQTRSIERLHEKLDIVKNDFHVMQLTAMKLELLMLDGKAKRIGE